MTERNADFRALGDTTPEVYEHEFRRLNSPLLPYAGELFRVLQPHTVLAGAMLAIEQSYWTDHRIIPKEYNNPFSLSAGKRGGVHTWQQFNSPIEGAQAFIDLITGPVFANIRTVPEFVSRYAPGSDGNDEARIVRRIFEYRDAYRALQGSDGAGETSLNFSTPIELPSINRRLITNKPAGVGWDNLGKRDVWGVALHRMQGTLWGTDGYFRNPSVSALTDFGIDSLTGEMLQWVDPFGTITPWASGPVSGAYGDGLAFVNRFRAQYGASVVNRFLASLEFSGYFRQPGTNVTTDTPIAAVAIRNAARWMAHFAHRLKLPWHTFPIVPAWGFSCVFWHQEFTLGTGKLCPGDVIMNATPEIIAQAREFMKLAQTGSAGVEPEPKPGLAYPAGMDKELATSLFGKLSLGGKTYAFDESGPVSVAWLTEGSKDGEFAKLQNVLEHNGKQYFAFADGLVLYQPEPKAAYRALGVGNPKPVGIETPKAA